MTKMSQQQCQIIPKATAPSTRTLLFSTQANRPRPNTTTTTNRRHNKKNQGPLMNERLIETLVRNNNKNKQMQSNNNTTPEDVQVRLVIDQGPTEPSVIEVVNLLNAMETSLEMDVDLIAVALDKDPPVIKAVDFSKLAYRQQKAGVAPSAGAAKAATKTKKGKKKTVVDGKVTKEFKFRAKIETHDLERKVKNMIQYLSKGHNCQITVSASRRCLSRNPNAAIDTITKVKEGIAVELPDNAAEGKLKHNEEKTYASLLMTPVGRKK